MSFWSSLCTILMLVVLSPSVAALADNNDGWELAQKVYNREDGRDSLAKANMTLIDKMGRRRERELEIAIKDFGALSKRYIYFSAPEGIKGTAFLAWENEDREDDQFLYLPALGRVRRIVSNQKSKSFVNTDFTYEDLERHKPADYDHRILSKADCFGKSCLLLESRAKDPNRSQYGKTVSWITPEGFVPVKIEFFDKQGHLIKLFTARELKLIDGIWTITSSVMQNLKKGHSTEMRIHEVRYNQGLSDDLFTQRRLERRP